jgi:ATP-binding cassette subfamily F protein uup
VVSHDRYFLNRVCTGILAFEGDQRITYSVGDYDYYLEKKARDSAAAAANKSVAPRSKAAAAPEANASRRSRKLSFKEMRELEGMELQIISVEEEIARIEALIAQPDFHQKHGQQTEELMAQVTAEKEKLAGLFIRWEELEKVSKGLG